jgi:hypothetical protein
VLQVSCCVGGAAILTGPEPQPFDKGLIFVKEADILLSGDKWTIAVNIALEDYASFIGTMKLVLGQVRRKIQVHRNPQNFSFDTHWEEIGRLEKMTRELENDSNSFRQLLFKEKSNRNPVVQGVRAKRGFVDVFGY